MYININSFWKFRRRFIVHFMVLIHFLYDESKSHAPKTLLLHDWRYTKFNLIIAKTRGIHKLAHIYHCLRLLRRRLLKTNKQNGWNDDSEKIYTLFLKWFVFSSYGLLECILITDVCVSMSICFCVCVCVLVCLHLLSMYFVWVRFQSPNLTEEISKGCSTAVGSFIIRA